MLWVGYVNVSVWWQKPSPKGTISDEFSPPEITNSRLGANVLSVKPGVGGGGEFEKLHPKVGRDVFVSTQRELTLAGLGLRTLVFRAYCSFIVSEKQFVCVKEQIAPISLLS